MINISSVADGTRELMQGKSSQRADPRVVEGPKWQTRGSAAEPPGTSDQSGR